MTEKVSSCPLDYTCVDSVAIWLENGIRELKGSDNLMCLEDLGGAQGDLLGLYQNCKMMTWHYLQNKLI